MMIITIMIIMGKNIYIKEIDSEIKLILINNFILVFPG